MLAALHSGDYVIQLLSYFNEAQHWSGWVERRYHREHVSANRVYFERERLKFFFLACIEEVLALEERDNGCHQVDFGSGCHDEVTTMFACIATI